MSHHADTTRTNSTGSPRAGSRAWILVLAAAIALGFGVSCRQRVRETPTVALPPQLPMEAPPQAERLRSLAIEVQTAPNPYAEADAITKLRSYMTSRDLTYRLHAVRTDTNATVNSPSVHTGPVRVTMEIFSGRESLYTFAFVPRDNRNLSLLGQ